SCRPLDIFDTEEAPSSSRPQSDLCLTGEFGAGGPAVFGRPAPGAASRGSPENLRARNPGFLRLHSSIALGVELGRVSIFRTKTRMVVFGAGCSDALALLPV